MYKIFAAKPSRPYIPDYNTLVPVECQRRDQAAKLCMALLRGGYTVHRIVLPSGQEIPRKDLEAAMTTLSEGQFQIKLAGEHHD
jgi:hypothetical protein